MDEANGETFNKHAFHQGAITSCLISLDFKGMCLWYQKSFNKNGLGGGSMGSGYLGRRLWSPLFVTFLRGLGRTSS